MTTRNVWRVEFLTPWGRIGPLLKGKGVPTPTTGLVLTEPSCSKYPSHTPPEPICTCGIHGVQDVRSLLNILKAAEYTRAWTCQHPVDEDQRKKASLLRLMVAYGSLSNTKPTIQPGSGELVASWSDGTATKAPYRPESHDVKMVGLSILGDPPGTWRGASFTMTRAVVQADEGDNLDAFAELLPIEYHLIEERGVPSLLSSVLARFIASGRTDGDWWTA